MANDTIQYVIGTALGEILVVNMRGEFLLSVPQCPGMRIDCILPWTRGLICAGPDGMIFPYEAT